VREEYKKLKKDYDKSEDDLKALQSVGQIIGEVLRQLDDEKCKDFFLFCFFLLLWRGRRCSWLFFFVVVVVKCLFANVLI